MQVGACVLNQLMFGKSIQATKSITARIKLKFPIFTIKFKIKKSQKHLNN